MSSFASDLRFSSGKLPMSAAAITNSIFYVPVFIAFSLECYRCYRMLFCGDNIRRTSNCLFMLAFSRLVIDVIDVIGTFAFSGLAFGRATLTADDSTQCRSLCATPACSRRTAAGGLATRFRCSATAGNILERRAYAKKASEPQR